MKKILSIIIICSIVVVACSKKSLPTISARTTEQPLPAKKIINVTPYLVKGKSIFTNYCGQCHDLPKPDQYTTQRWVGILSYMIPRARLNDEQGVHVTAYLKANAQQ